jgi:hypothetical protein
MPQTPAVLPIDREDDERQARLDAMMNHLRVQTDILNKIADAVHKKPRRRRAAPKARRRRRGG